MQLHMRLLVQLALMTLTAAACTEGGNSAALSSVDDRVEILTPPTSLPSSALEDLDPAQQEVLADGFVTDSEMERMLFAYAACLESGGLKVVDLKWNSERGDISIGYEAGSSPEEGEPEQYAAWCAQRFFDTALGLWYAGRDHEADLERARVTRISCLAEQDIEVDAGMSWEELVTMDDPNVDLLRLSDCEHRP